MTNINYTGSNYTLCNIDEFAKDLFYLIEECKAKGQREIAVDIETVSLKVTDAGIYSISFAVYDKETDSYKALALLVRNNKYIYERLAKIFNYLNKENFSVIFHKANYDVPVLIYNLYMNQDISNNQGLLNGIDIFSNLEDTLIMAYLCFNSCSRPSLSLKDLMAKDMGEDWSLNEIKRVDQVDPEELLTYNNKDTVATMALFHTLCEILKKEDQEYLYRNLFLKILLNNIEMQLIGLPIDMDEVLKLEKELTNTLENLSKKIHKSMSVKRAMYLIGKQLQHKYNSTHKRKQKTLRESLVPFNISSSKQLQVLFYDVLKIPIISTTESGSPSTASGTIDKLLNNDSLSDYIKQLLKDIQLYSKTSKILDAFIPAFKGAVQDKYGNYHLLGYFNLGGTVSGRLSSSSPNLQQIPSTGTIYAKAVKKCFKAPKGWLFVGVDYHSLEDYISALTTKDENKLKVYLDHYDGHCLRAYTYFGDQMPDIKLATSDDECYINEETGEIFIKNN